MTTRTRTYPSDHEIAAKAAESPDQVAIITGLIVATRDTFRAFCGPQADRAASKAAWRDHMIPRRELLTYGVRAIDIEGMRSTTQTETDTTIRARHLDDPATCRHAQNIQDPGHCSYCGIALTQPAEFIPQPAPGIGEKIDAEIAAWDAQRTKKDIPMAKAQNVFVAIDYINGGTASVATIYTGSRVLRAIADAATRAGLSVVATDRYWNGNRAVEMHLSDDGARHTDTLYVHHYHTTDLDRFIADMAAWHQTVLTDGIAA